MHKDHSGVHTLAPTYFVVFGATGDLARKKLLPALFSLYRSGTVPTHFRIVAFSRRPWGDSEYRKFAEELLLKGAPDQISLISEFLSHVQYVRGNFDERSSYETLKQTLESFDATLGVCANKLFYLAVPPVHYEKIIEELAHSSLTEGCSDETGWTRVLIEKPFGSDGKSAEKLDVLLGTLFKEEQIFRIDHYLAKETVQNILVFRFQNGMFEPLMNAAHIERVHIELFEKEGVGERGEFYNAQGALLDVGQNHMLQLLALIAMDKPKNVTPEALREARARVLGELLPPDAHSFMRGQYKEYKAETKISDSQTETFFRLTAGLDNDRFREVPFILESGKGLPESTARIRIVFKKSNAELAAEIQNELVFEIQPEEGIEIRLAVKKPGLAFAVEKKTLSYHYAKNQGGTSPYEKILFDSLTGDQTLFPSTKEIKAQWSFIEALLAHKKSVPLMYYAKGSWPLKVEKFLL